MEVSAFSVGHHLSDLLGRNVAAKVCSGAEFSAQTQTACYTVQPNDGTAVVKIDSHLLAMLGGTMIGFPQAEIDAQIRSGEFDINLTDASREVMNVLSAVIVSAGRAIFKGLYLRPNEYSKHAHDLLQGGFCPLNLQLTLTGNKPGYMVIASDVV